MVITKTRFINYTKCPRYVALDKVKNQKFSLTTLESYRKEEENEKLLEIINSMYNVEDDEIVDLIDIENPSLNVMMNYYKEIEELTEEKVKRLFGGNTISSLETYSQKCFSCDLRNNKYICYLDVYNEVDDTINIIETKATTSNKFISLESGHKGCDKYSIFTFYNGIYHLKEDITYYDIKNEMKIDNYNKLRSKLLDRYSDVGKYVFDLAVQRFIIENSNETKGKKINYYLAILNHEYVFDGEYVYGEANYKTDSNGNDIIVLFDFNKITLEYQGYISELVKKLERYINENSIEKVDLGKWCFYKQQTQCKYFKNICGSDIPKTNSSLNYMNNGFGFKDEFGNIHKGLNLINEGYINMLDIPSNWIKNNNHFIQRDCLQNNIEYINKKKIKDLLKTIKYPIYHLDFETFNCPIPRFRGEKCYSQSTFEFSLHIERAPGICDKDDDNYIFLAEDQSDCREELIKMLCKLIKNDGTLFAQNVSFERSRIKELANIFPQYKEQLLGIIENYFDLIYILKTNKQLYLDLGYDEEECMKVNYYHKNLSGSYSIKKTLPIFSDLSYSDLDVHNGTDAIVTYGNYPNMSVEERKKMQEALRVYCKQDTWAMVVILDEIRKRVDNDE